MKRLAVFLGICLGLFSLWLANAPPASACMVRFPQPEDAFRDATAVFKGRVISTFSPYSLPLTSKIGRWSAMYLPPVIADPLIYHLFTDRTEFEVVAAWKGVTSTSVVVLSPSGCGGIPFRPGQEYIVFAEGLEGRLVTSARHGTMSTTFPNGAMYQNHLAGMPTIPLQPGFSWFTFGRMGCLSSLILVGLLVFSRRRWGHRAVNEE